MSSLIPVRPEIAEKAWVDEAAYRKLYEQSISDPEGFWAEQGKRKNARNLLAPIYGWFTEGFETGDLKDAKRLIDSLA